MNENKIYWLLIGNKFIYLLIQIILFVLVLSLNSYDTPQGEWGISSIRQFSLTLLCLMMMLRFFYLNFSTVFIVFMFILSCSSIFYSELINKLSQYNSTQSLAGFIVQNNIESIVTIIITVFVIFSLTSSHKDQAINR